MNFTNKTVFEILIKPNKHNVKSYILNPKKQNKQTKFSHTKLKQLRKCLLKPQNQ